MYERLVDYDVEMLEYNAMALRLEGHELESAEEIETWRAAYLWDEIFRRERGRDAGSLDELNNFIEETLTKIAVAFGVDADYLLEGLWD